MCDINKNKSYVLRFKVNKYQEGNIHVKTEYCKTSLMTKYEITEQIFEIITMQQFILRAGHKNFGDKGGKTLTKELTQLHAITTFITIDSENFQIKRGDNQYHH